MLSRLTIVRRSASGPLAPQVLAMAKTNVNPMRSSVVAASRCYQSSSSSSSPSSGDQFDSACLVSSVRSKDFSKTDLAQDSFFALHRPLLGSMASRQGFAQECQGKYWGLDQRRGSVDDLSSYLSSLAPFTPPSSLSQDVLRNIESKQLSVPNMDCVSSIQQQIESVPIQSIMDNLEETNAMHMTSVLRKRKIKMRKHKYKKLRKRTRALRKKLGK
ncbi:hypothetical protein BGZ70_008240 [Mortierella alpina]|uniref:Small ribosomal subunit protein mS38 n=1 Tax=Mortierella alpina TaxID=64518 RepID=A0A9P6J690_MORAP|nr:hypothetical protein BGZ70_008240 [Mortierella alpina]